MLNKTILLVSLAACSSSPSPDPSDAASPTAQVELAYNPSSDSNAIMAPFEIGTTSVTGDPRGTLEIMVDEMGGSRHFSITLDGPLAVGQRVRKGMRYDEGGLRIWESAEDNELTGELTIDRLDADGLAFTLDDHQLVAKQFTEAVAVVNFTGSGEVAFP